MGIDAVSKQSKADIMVFGLNPLALEVVKNLVLSGCRKLTICDDEVVKPQDLAGGFFYTQEDIGKKRIESILYKIR
jgi:molybdopterin/thiamine biosynthesis adenylyltransferase